MTNTEEFVELVKQNPDLPIIPMVSTKVVEDDSYSCYWEGTWKQAKVLNYCRGYERIHLEIDELEEILPDMSAKYSYTKDNKNFYGDDLTDEELDELFNALPWEKAIIVYIWPPKGHY